MHPRHAQIRAIANALNLTTALGLRIARLGRAAVRQGPDGLWLADGYQLAFPVAGAFTVGNVVITSHDFEALRSAYPDLLGHESRHATQYAWLGILFLPTYALAAAWSWMRYRHPAYGNIFEQHAGLVSGNYLTEEEAHNRPTTQR